VQILGAYVVKEELRSVLALAGTNPQRHVKAWLLVTQCTTASSAYAKISDYAESEFSAQAPSVIV
jgi:hypothetical protein